MKKNKTFIALYFIISLLLLCSEYTGNSIVAMFAYYALLLANLWNAVRLLNKYSNQTKTSAGFIWKYKK